MTSNITCHPFSSTNFWHPCSLSCSWWFPSVMVEMPGPSSPTTRWVAFHRVLWTLQLDKHSTAHSACLPAVCIAQTRPMALFYLPSPFYLSSSPLLCWGKKNNCHENMTPGSCALCLDAYKSILYGGLCRGLQDMCAPSFPFSHPNHRTIFRSGDHREGGGERGGVVVSQ